jgi:hypothetical protein
MGTVFSFELNERGTVAFVFTQRGPGRLVGGVCSAPDRANQHRPPCTRTSVAGTLKLTGVKGVNHVVFQGRLAPSRVLEPGVYSLTVTASIATHQRTTSRSLSFTIVK